MKNLEDYLIYLGKVIVVAEVFKEYSDQAKKAGILQFDEEEQAETISYCLQKTIQAATDQMSLVIERCNATEKDIAAEVKGILKKQKGKI